MSQFPYDRWLDLKLSPLENLRFQAGRPLRAVRRYIDNHPLLRRPRAIWFDRKYFPRADFDGSTGLPSCAAFETIGCRTRHGRSVVFWYLNNGTPKPNRARGIHLPDGTRGQAHDSFCGWRRAGSGRRKWLHGQIEIRADNVAFHDNDDQAARYTPPTDENAALARALASHQPFVAALTDDGFAEVAHTLLKNGEWFRIGERRDRYYFHDPDADALIPGLRDVGETWGDYKYGPSMAKQSAKTAARHAKHLKQILRQLGWRTYTHDELVALARADFKARAKARAAALDLIAGSEARPAASFAVIQDSARESATVNYEGDDETWFDDDLTVREQKAAGIETTQRFNALARSGRIDAEERKRLFAMIYGVSTYGEPNENR